MNGSKILFAYRKRLINIRLENSALSQGRAIFIKYKVHFVLTLYYIKYLAGGKIMLYQEGYVYHIKEEYFEKVQDKNLMQNKENGTYRPTFFCMRDSKTSLLWLVPLSSRVEKYKILHDKQVSRYGKCLTIVLGEFDGKESAFLLQNMFPITDYYLDHIHTRNNNPVPVKHSISKIISTNMKQIRQLYIRGKKIVFPDIARLEEIMLSELSQKQHLSSSSKKGE